MCIRDRDMEYLTQEARDMAKAPGFAEGFAAAYENLDSLLAEM